ncbi:MAG: Ig-like domain-containing protein, partial [Anaerolineales bacterium]|nr:Ig-like domain-containing protein [Anaerolineales bacterium]
MADATNPTLRESEPSDNAYTVSTSADIVLTFSEAITGDTSKITLYQKQGDTELNSTVTISGNTVTINPDADLSPSGGYYIKILAAAIDDIAGNSYAGITTETGLNFSTSSFDGLEGGNLAPPSTLEHTAYKSILVFSIPLQQGQFIEYDPNDGFGNWFYFYEATSPISGDLGTELYNYLDDQSPENRDKVNDIFKPDTGILWCCGGQDDHDGNTSTNNALFRHNTSSGNNSSSWGLKTQNASKEATVDWDIGNNATNTRLVRWLYDTDGYLKAYHNNPSAGQDTDGDGWTDFARAQSRDTYIPSSGNTGYLYLAFANKNSESHHTPMMFTTPPTLTSTSPIDNANNVVTTSDIVLTFSEEVDAETGNISIHKSDNTLIEAISVTSGQVTGSGTTQITIDPADDLDDDTSYYVKIASTAFDNATSNSYSGISDTSTFNFTTITHTQTPTTTPTNTASATELDYTDSPPTSTATRTPTIT